MATWRDEVILEGEFILLPKKKVHKVTLTQRGLFFNPISSSSNVFEEKSIQVSDIIGCHLLEPNGLQATSSTESDSSNRNRSSSRGSSDLPSDHETVNPSNIKFPKTFDPSSSGFVVFAYPFRKKVFSGKKVRHRVVVSFSSPPSNEVYEERRKTAEKWKNVLNCLCRDVHVDVNDVSTCVPPPRGKLLILINPHSGPGKALILFKNVIAPMLKEANIPYKEYVTEYAGHASDMMKDISFAEWHGVVIVSGDGLIFETINGLMSRGDWVSSIHVPIGCLPGGSGNALCCSINYAAGEPFDNNFALHSTFVLIKHRVVPMDLVIVHLPDRTLYSFLSFAWGITADIDYESEKFRSLGETRFTLWAIKRIVGLRTYKGKLSFLPVAEYTPRESPSSANKVLTKVRRFSLRSQSSSKSNVSSSDGNSPKLLSRRSLNLDQSNGSEAQLHPYSNNVSGDEDATLSAEHNCCDIMSENGKEDFHKKGLNNSCDDVCKNDSTIPRNDHSSVSEPAADIHQAASSVDDRTPLTESNLSQQTSSEPMHLGEPLPQKMSPHQISHISSSENSADFNRNTGNGSSSSAVPKFKEGMTVMAEAQEISVEEEMYRGHKKNYEPVPCPLLPPIDGPVPDNWVSVEGDFVLVLGVYQTHMGTEMLAAPDAQLNDGLINLMFVKEGISRNALLNLFLAFGEGTQVCSPHVETVKVLAFRLEPETADGHYMIDGERFDPMPCQAQILPGLAKIMAIK